MNVIAHDVLLRFGDNPSSYLAMNTGTAQFAEHGGTGFVPHVLAGRHHALALFGPIAANADGKRRLWEDFERWCAKNDRAIVVLQASQDFGRVLARRGYAVNQLGAAFSAQLEDFDLKGKKFKPIRNNIGNASRAGVTVRELDHDDYPSVRDALDDIDARWLRAKRRGTRPLRFMVGDRYQARQRARRIFLVEHDRRIIGYSTFVPSPERAGNGYLWDLTRRIPEAPRGTNELLIRTAAETLRDEGHDWLHMGLTPFVELRNEWELSPSAHWLRTVAGLVASHGAWLYPARNNLRFKLKWHPQRVVPEYMGFQNGASVTAVLATLRRLGVLP